MECFAILIFASLCGLLGQIVDIDSNASFNNILTKLHVGVISTNTSNRKVHLVRSGWLVVLGLTALSDSSSVYIGQSPKEREKEKRKDRGE